MFSLIKKNRTSLNKDLLYPLVYLVFVLLLDSWVSKTTITPFCLALGLLVMAFQMRPAIILIWSSIYIFTIFLIFYYPPMTNLVGFTGNANKFTAAVRVGNAFCTAILAYFLCYYIHIIRKALKDRHTILKAIPLPIISSNFVGDIIYANDEAKKRFQITSDESNLINFFKLFSTEGEDENLINMYYKNFQGISGDGSMKLNYHGHKFFGITRLLKSDSGGSMLTIMTPESLLHEINEKQLVKSSFINQNYSVLKIVIMIQCTNLGGMEHNMLLLIKEMLKMGVEVEVVSLHKVGQLAEKMKSMHIPYEGCSYSGPWGFFSILKLHRLLSRKKADGLLMIGHNLMGEIALGNLWKDHRALSIHYHHQGVKHPLIWKLIYGIACKKFRSVVFVSKYIMDEAISIVPSLKKLSLMVSTPVEPQSLTMNSDRVASRKRLGIPEECVVVGNAGWLIQRKRWDVFLDVAHAALSKEDNLRFVIAGDGELRPVLEKKARDAGIFEKIVWMGWQTNLKDFYSTIDILLFNSDWDAQARSPLEAMSHGIPVVASILAGGTQEVIKNDSCSILMDKHDVNKLSEEIIKLTRNSDLRKSMGQNALKRICEYGSPTNHALKVLAAMGFSPTN